MLRRLAILPRFPFGDARHDVLVPLAPDISAGRCAAAGYSSRVQPPVQERLTVMSSLRLKVKTEGTDPCRRLG